MNQNKETQIINDCDKYLRNKLNITKIIYGGSYALYMQDIKLPREFHDIDVYLPELSTNETRKLKLDFEIPIHLLVPYKDLRSPEYKEIEFENKKYLVMLPQYIADCKQHIVNWINDRFTEDQKLKREELIRKNEEDIKFLRDNKYIK